MTFFEKKNFLKYILKFSWVDLELSKGICDLESRLISENRLIESDNDTPDTDESDIEDVDFMNDKIGSEQRRIRHREKLEEDKNRKIESRRTWLLKQIKNCERKETVR